VAGNNSETSNERLPGHAFTSRVSDRDVGLYPRCYFAALTGYDALDKRGRSVVGSESQPSTGLNLAQRPPESPAPGAVCCRSNGRQSNGVLAKVIPAGQTTCMDIKCRCCGKYQATGKDLLCIVCRRAACWAWELVGRA
jgi:hypothetical protein